MDDLSFEICIGATPINNCWVAFATRNNTVFVHTVQILNLSAEDAHKYLYSAIQELIGAKLLELNPDLMPI